MSETNETRDTAARTTPTIPSTSTAGLRVGATVFDASGRTVGTVEQVAQDFLQVNGQPLPLSEVARVGDDGVHLAGDSVRAGSQPPAPPAERVETVAAAGGAGGVVAPDARTMEVRAPDRTADELRVPVVEERLEVTKRPTAAGELLVHTRVEQAEQRIPVSLLREEVEVQRVPVNRVLEAAEAPVGTRTEGEWLIVPVIEEEVVVEKRLVLREEVRIRTRRTTEEQEIRETVRRQRVELDDSGLPGSIPAAAADTHTRPRSDARGG